MTFDRLRHIPREEITLGRLARAGWRRLAAIPDDIAYRVKAGPGSENYRQLAALRDQHKGERCFILGNGPSLAKTDLSRLSGEVSFGLNRIYLMFDKSEFRPTHYVCMNGLVLEQSAERIRQLEMPRFLNWNRRQLFDGQKNAFFLREIFSPGFSTDLALGVWGGATVTYVALQVAYHMGFSEVVLLGVDHHYQATGTPHSTIVGRGGDEDHFVQNYFPKGFRWQLPDLRTSEIAYRMARAAFEADDRRVVDATLGGALEVFPKVDFEDVVGNRQPQERSESPESGDKNATEPAPVRSETTSPSQPLVTIGIVSWNSASDLPACLEAIHAQDYPNLELIAVDNASEDGSIEVVVAHAPEAQLVKLDENRGYGAGHNLAIGISHGEYYLALNPDVVMKPAYVSGLVEALEKRPDYGSAMGKLWLSGRESAGTPLLDGAGLFIDRRRHQYLRGHGQADRGQFDTSEEIFGVDGAAPLYRRQALQDLEIRGQIFDETYFIHMEDVDLSWRARLLGWRAWYEPRATAFHDRTFRPGERAPVPKSRRRDAVKNRYVTICKNEAPETWRRDWLQILTYDARILGYILLMEQSSLGAYTALFSQRKALREWRASIWARVKVLPEERQEWFE